MSNELVSIIIATKNSSNTLDACLNSIKNQTYKNIEIVVGDNDSTDETIKIVKKYNALLISLAGAGDFRCRQRNLAAQKSSGKYIFIIDSDMELSPYVVAQCIDKFERNDTIRGIVIPEESFGIGFWSKCKKLERSFYLGIEWMEAARFFLRENFLKVGGYNEMMTSGEDWDLSQRIEKLGLIARIDALIYHNEGEITLVKTIKKKFYYASKIRFYAANISSEKKFRKQTSIIERYKLFILDWRKLLKNPILGISMIFLKTCEFAFGGIGYFFSIIKKGL